MKAVVTGLCTALVLAFAASKLLEPNQTPASQAYATEGVRLDHH